MTNHRKNIENARPPQSTYDALARKIACDDLGALESFENHADGTCRYFFEFGAITITKFLEARVTFNEQD